MLIVVLLVGILVALAAPRFRSSRSEYRVRLAAWRVATDLQTVSALALAQGRNIQMNFFSDNPARDSRYWVAGVDHRFLNYSLIDVSLGEEPYRVGLSGAPAAIVYDMYGLPDDDYDLYITNESGRSWKIMIRRDTSRVEVVDVR